MNDPVRYTYASDKLGFYVVVNDQEILSQVSRLMNRSGYVGMMDTAGRLQYLVDGRRGSPHAVRRILDTTEKIIEDHENTTTSLMQYLGVAADQVLAAHGVSQSLKGYRYIRYMLLAAGLDESKLKPISKTLYPEAAGHFHVSIGQVERDMRYALQKTDLRQRGLSSAAAFCRLYDEMIGYALQLEEKGMPSDNP